ncbi:MAG: hypothetical protein ACREGF_03425 [Candidatus Saccharimonadales bacterium]
MVCIYCGRPSRVINSRLQKKPNRIWRRRACTSCQAVWTTVEALDERGAIAVCREKSGKIVPFSADELFISLYESCRHRPLATRDARALCDTIASQILSAKNQPQAGLVALGDIQLTAERVLKRFDRTSYVHYQAYFGTKQLGKNT